MRTKREAPCDYRSFSDPYTGLATMIFVQADNDLKMLNGAESAYKGGVLLSKRDIPFREAVAEIENRMYMTEAAKEEDGLQEH